MTSAILLAVAALALVSANPTHNHVRHLRHSKDYSIVNLQNAVRHSLCHFAVRTDTHSARVPEVLKHIDCLYEDPRLSKECSMHSQHSCVQLQDTVSIMYRNSTGHYYAGSIQLNVGCVCAPVELALTAKLPTPGRR